MRIVWPTVPHYRQIAVCGWAVPHGCCEQQCSCVKISNIPAVYHAFQDKVEINLTDKNGKTPIMLAKGRKHEKVIAYLQKELKRRSSLISRIDTW